MACGDDRGDGANGARAAVVALVLIRLRTGQPAALPSSANMIRMKLLPPLRKPFGRWTLRVGAQCVANLPRREVAPSATAHVNARCLGLRAGFVQNGSRYPQTDREVVLPC